VRFCGWLLALSPDLSYTGAAVLAEQLFLGRVSVGAEFSCTPFPSLPSPSLASCVRRSCPSPSHPPAISWLPSLRFAPSIPSPSVESWWLRSCGSRAKVRRARLLLGAAERAGEGAVGCIQRGGKVPAAECCLLGRVYYPERVLGTMEGWCWFYLGR